MIDVSLKSQELLKFEFQITLRTSVQLNLQIMVIAVTYNSGITVLCIERFSINCTMLYELDSVTDPAAGQIAQITGYLQKRIKDHLPA